MNLRATGRESMDWILLSQDRFQWRALLNTLMNDDYHLPEDDNHHSHRRGNLKSYRLMNL
jgi:hypothetical protein